MRRLLLACAAIAPAIVMLLFWSRPELDSRLAWPLFHFYVVTYTTFTAAVVSILLSVSLEQVARPRHVLAAVAFAVMGAIFLTHGAPTPGALTIHFHPAIQWSAWLTLLSGGLIFLVASLDSTEDIRPDFPVRRVVAIAGVLVALYLLVVVFKPGWLTALGRLAAPWLTDLVFYLTLAIWIVAAWRLLRISLRSGDRVDLMLAFVAVWLTQATVSMHRLPLFNLSWWLYHFILLVAFLAVTGVLVAAYEQARRFRLLPYYVGVSLVITPLLSLTASHLFGEYAARLLTDEIESAAIAQVEALSVELTASLPPDSTPEYVRSHYASRLFGLSLGTLTIYDPDGQVSHPPDEGDPRSVSNGDRPYFQQALGGTAVVRFYDLQNPPYNVELQEPSHVMKSFSPVLSPGGGEPVGVLMTLAPVPQLTQGVLRARTIGLAIAAATMSLHFGVLLLVVWRAGRIIQSRTQELALANADLRRSEQIREDLTGMIVHDLRSPLTAITVTLDLLSRPEVQARQESRDRYVQGARQASRRMDHLIEDILAVSKIEAGELQLDCRPVAVGALLKERVNEFSPMAAADRKTLTLDCQPEATAELDQVLIGRVVDNLVSNAIKYTLPGGTIAVVARQVGESLVVTVRDNGEGVPLDYRDQIFGKFFQVPGQSNGSTGRKGTGLGLAFCRLIVEAHGGRIWVEDAPGGGSDFTFRVPLTI